MMMKLITILLALTLLAPDTRAQAFENKFQYVVAISSTDCANCLAIGLILEKLPFFSKIRYVFREEDRRQAHQLLKELVRLPISNDRNQVQFSDSLLRVFDVRQSTLLLFDTTGAVSFRMQLKLLGEESCRRKLTEFLKLQPLLFQRTKLLPDSIVCSPRSFLLAGQRHFWLYDPRYQQLTEFDFGLLGNPVRYQRDSWPLWKAHQTYFGDTSGFRSVRESLPSLAKIGKNKLELGRVFVNGDSIYGYVTYRYPERTITQRDTILDVFPKTFLTRLTKGAPVDWRIWSSDADSADYLTGMGAGMHKTATGWEAVTIQYDVKPTVRTPLVANVIDTGVDICWKGMLAYPTVPKLHCDPKLEYNYLEAYFLENVMAFRYTPEISIRDRNTSFFLPGFSNKANNFSNLARPVIEFEIVAAKRLPEFSALTRRAAGLLIRNYEKYYYVVINSDDAQVLWQRELALPGGKKINWTLTSRGNLLGFDPQDNSLYTIRLAETLSVTSPPPAPTAR